MTDQSLKQSVLDELAWDPSVSEAHIGVTAHGGVVTLTGHVGSYAEKCAAEHAGQCVAAEWLGPMGWTRFLWCRK